MSDPRERGVAVASERCATKCSAAPLHLATKNTHSLRYAEFAVLLGHGLSPHMVKRAQRHRKPHTLRRKTLTIMWTYMPCFVDVQEAVGFIFDFAWSAKAKSYIEIGNAYRFASVFGHARFAPNKLNVCLLKEEARMLVRRDKENLGLMRYLYHYVFSEAKKPKIKLIQVPR